MKGMLIVTKKQLKEILKDANTSGATETEQFTINIIQTLLYWHID